MLCGFFVGERSEDQEVLLQGKGLQEAHPSQGYPVQEGQGFSLCARYVHTLSYGMDVLSGWM
jgi:hypothetical protein